MKLKQRKYLTMAEISGVSNHLKAGMRQVEIAQKFGVSTATVSRIGVRRKIELPGKRGRPRGGREARTIQNASLQIPPFSGVRATIIARGHLVFLRVPRKDACPPIKRT